MAVLSHRFLYKKISKSIGNLFEQGWVSTLESIRRSVSDYAKANSKVQLVLMSGFLTESTFLFHIRFQTSWCQKLAQRVALTIQWYYFDT